jgi:serine protease
MVIRRLHRALLVVGLYVLAGAWTAASAGPWRSYAPGEEPTDRIIVKWRDSGFAAVQMVGTAERTARLSQSTGVPLHPMRELHDRLDLMRLDAPIRGGAMRHVIARLRADPAVQYAEADQRRYALAFPDDPPNDPRFVAGSDAVGQWVGQWYLHDPSATAPAAIGATTAWKTASGQNYVIAIIDTGIDLKHPDLGTYGQGGKLLPGFDFICDDQGINCSTFSASYTYLVANDGDGWDGDPTDPGEWISAVDLARSDGFFKGCGGGPNQDQPINSTWHGTRVAGIAAALTNNNVGIAGVAYGSYILPVRVIGKCSGYISDIVAGMYWAAGMSNTLPSAVPVNIYPAQVLNLSVGGRAPCSQTEQEAVTAITQDGHVVVAAAGNDGGPVDAPANCVGAFAVGGIREVGTKVGYSNVSSTAATVSIAAPAGNCVNLNTSYPWTQPCEFSIETTSNDGVTVPANSFYTYSLFVPSYTGNVLNEGSVGTSYAAPLVSGVVAMMVQVNPGLSASQIIARIQAAATPFPVPATPPAGGVCHIAALTTDSNGNYTDVQAQECQCTTTTCGAGMLNAPAALAQAVQPQASIVTTPDTASIGQTVTLDGSGSSAATGSFLTAYHWTVDPGVAIANASSPIASLKFPAFRPITVTLTVTDSAGRQGVASQVVNSKDFKATKGGGEIGLQTLVILSLGLCGAFLRRRGPSAVMLRGRPPRGGSPDSPNCEER